MDHAGTGEFFMVRNNDKTSVFEGGCHCGAVRYMVTASLENAIMCHCQLCRKLHGHVSSYAQFDATALTMVRDEGLRWYRMSPKTDRGFCKECGSGLFWRPVKADHMALTPGTLDDSKDLKTAGQIFCADKGDYYPIDPSIKESAAS